MSTDLACAVCGVGLVRRKDGMLFHDDELPRGVEYHAPQADERATVDAALADDDKRLTPSERMANATERIAAALERLAELKRRA